MLTMLHSGFFDRPQRRRAAMCLVTIGLLLLVAACRKASVEPPAEPPADLKAVDEMTVEELIAAHRRAVGELKPSGRDAHLDTVRISYIQRHEEFSMQRLLMCDASGRARVTYQITPLVIRDLAEGASYDGQALWRLSRQGKVRGPLAEDLSGDMPPPIAWTILELGLTPLYCPLADKLGFEVRRDPIPTQDASAYALLIGPSGRPYLRVILDRRTHQIRRVQRLLSGSVQVTVDWRDYWRSPGLNLSLPQKMVSYSGESTDKPAATWEMALLQSMRLITQPAAAYADGKLPDLTERMQQQSRFVLHAVVPVPANPQSVHAADLDGDGRLDLVVPADGTVAVLYHDGRTPYGPWEPLLNRDGLHRCALPTDLDGDGRPDLLVVQNAPPTMPMDFIHLLRNAGHRQFEDPVPLSAPKGTEWLAAALLNDDWVMDFAAVSRLQSLVVVFPGRVVPLPGRIELRPVSDYELELDGQGRRLAVGDFNGDYLADIVATDEARLIVLTQKGPGATKLDYETADYAAGELPFAVAVADFNGDGRDDVAAGNGGDINGDAAPEVVILLADQEGKLVNTTTLVAGSGVAALAAADFDDDGDIDLAAACFENHSVYVWPNNGDATFANPDVLWTDYAPRGLAAADFDGDGRRDLAVVHQYANSVAILLNRNPWHEFLEEQPATAPAPTTRPTATTNASSDQDDRRARAPGPCHKLPV